ncbi:hypothetical protein [Microseira wollei]|uniref:VWA containing CoxE family protein n=1 Tax=Microseira wollei NIES-4236 TaxID=2530354 RepID=A0AAV3XBT5_9CYAN|nr:hypothetical protein [Microseira wollei]GET39953.1 hypothetical protein MiSe_47260 [Microseira wollei NIES-4236]
MNPAEVRLLNVLLSLFKELRKWGLPLGVEEYMLALRSLQAGFGIGDRNSLERLCCTLWTKSETEARLLKRLLDEVIKQPVKIPQSTPTESPQTFPETSQQSQPQTPSKEPEKSATSSTPSPVSEISEPSSSEALLEEPEQTVSQPTSPAEIPLDIDEPEQVIQAIRQNWDNSLEMSYYRQNSVDEYLPVTPRQIKQSWRFLRRRVREGSLAELDVEGTVEKICQQGVLLEPVMMPSYKNRAELVLLVDQGGSMVPFHHLSRQLIDKAQQGGNLTQIGVYYFYNYPEKYLYTDPNRLKYQLVTSILESIDSRTGVLIVSDAGAARGNLNEVRVEYTVKFLKQLEQSVRYYAWLNPMPNDSWQDTTAGEIARFVPMFEMSREGLNAAINTLRGRYVYWERPYQGTVY